MNNQNNKDNNTNNLLNQETWNDQLYGFYYNQLANQLKKKLKKPKFKITEIIRLTHQEEIFVN